MVSKSRSLLLAASLFAVSAGVAMAQQQNNAVGNQGNNNAVTGDTAYQARPSGNYSSSAMNTTPGSTGRTVVPGTNSSQAGSAEATAEQKSGTGASGGK